MKLFILLKKTKKKLRMQELEVKYWVGSNDTKKNLEGARIEMEHGKA